MKRPRPRSADNLHHSPLLLCRCVSCCAYHVRSVWLLMTRARPSFVSLGIDDTTFSPLRPSTRCIFSPPRSSGWDELRLLPRRRLGLGGRDHHIRLGIASEKLLCSVGSRREGPISRPKVRASAGQSIWPSLPNLTLRPPRLSVWLPSIAFWPIRIGFAGHFSTAAMRLLGLLPVTSIRTEGKLEI
jgi:hypothetical protein